MLPAVYSVIPASPTMLLPGSIVTNGFLSDFAEISSETFASTIARKLSYASRLNALSSAV